MAKNRFDLIDGCCQFFKSLRLQLPSQTHPLSFSLKLYVHHHLRHVARQVGAVLVVEVGRAAEARHALGVLLVDDGGARAR